jgi:hypothetical protein
LLKLTVRQSPTLLEHLRTYQVDGATVESALFAGGRLQYPGRKEIEQELGYSDPYTLELESRVIDGFFQSISASIRFLSAEATAGLRGVDDTLDLLWGSHAAYPRRINEGPSLDRLVAALVMVEEARSGRQAGADIEYASAVLVRGLTAAGFPAGRRALEEICADAPPACVGLGMVEIG